MPVLDTSFLVDLIYGKNEALTLLSRLEEDGVLCTTVMNALELYKGAYLSNKPTENLNKVKRVLGTLSVLPIDKSVYTVFGASSASLKANGRSIGDFDTVIVAIVLCYDGKLVTSDTHFHEVPGLEVIEF